MPAQPLTNEQKADAARLKAIYQSKKAKLGLTQISLAAECGWESQGTVSQYLNGKIPLNLEAALKFSKHLQSEVSEFSPSLANALPRNSAGTTPTSIGAMKLATAHSPTMGNNVVVIRHYDTGGAMGDGGVILRDQPGLIESWTVTPEWIQKNIKNCSAAANLCVVTGFGDSMRPLYEPGDPLIVDTGVKQVDFDGIYFFRVGNEGFIKRLQRIPGEGLVAISENKAYREWTIREGMDFEVFGRIVKAWRSEDY